MKLIISAAIFLSPLLLLGCSSAPITSNVGYQPVASSTGASLPELTPAQKLKIGQKIWQNESGGKITGLTHWNDGEEFPSIGIGHFIWYPAGYQGPFTESFPAFINFARSRGSQDIPTWVLQSPDCPWQKKAAFIRDFNGQKLTSLRNWLARNVALQTDFIIAKSRSALPKILVAAPATERSRIQQNYAKVSSTPHGTYALIDYVNFKGEGINPKERYNGQGWGLLQVLSEMRNVPSGQPAASEFAAAAARTLDRRIFNSPPARNEKRWQAGWRNRCATYAKPL